MLFGVLKTSSGRNVFVCLRLFWKVLFSTREACGGTSVTVAFWNCGMRLFLRAWLILSNRDRSLSAAALIVDILLMKISFSTRLLQAEKAACTTAGFFFSATLSLARLFENITKTFHQSVHSFKWRNSYKMWKLYFYISIVCTAKLYEYCRVWTASGIKKFPNYKLCLFIVLSTLFLFVCFFSKLDDCKC